MPLFTVPQPCPEKVTSMPQSGEGFFCGTCSRVVIDFRSKSNSEILGIISSRGTQKTCGVFRTSQVENAARPSFSLARFFAALLLVFGGAMFTSCKEPAPPPQVPPTPEITGVVLCEPPTFVDSAGDSSSVIHDTLQPK